MTYYCDPCGTKKGFPVGETSTLGLCEVCRKLVMCNDVWLVDPVPVAHWSNCKENKNVSTI